MREFDVGIGALVVLHGHGDEPASAREWGRRVAPAGWEVVAPGASRDDEGVRSWFGTGPRGADGDELRRSAGRIAELVARLQETGRPVAVVGFSQGGALALSLGLAGCRPDAVASVCGFLPDVDDDDLLERLGTGPGDPPTLLVAGSADEHVPAFLSTDAAAVLSAGGRPVTSVVEDGGHEVTTQAADRVRAWVAEQLARSIRVSVGLPVDRTDTGAELVSGEAIAELAAAYERLGFAAAYVTDHPAPDDRWLAGGGHQAMEPTVALATAAAATRRLLLHTNVYVLPYRNPFMAAKSLASLDVVSGGRLIVGVAAGYLRPEFRAVGTDFEDRTARLEEALQLLPRIWSETSVAADGTGFEARGVTAEPRPWQRPHPPIWVGGNSPAAMRRAVRWAQGWSPFPTPGGMEAAVRTSAIADMDDLRAALDRARELCEAEGRTTPLTICFVPFSLQGYLRDPVGGLAPMVDEIAEMESIGVDWVALQVPGLARAEVADRAAALAQALDLR
ncbi:TIGR03619 family F420-dependent LLM class oxidoreductase [Dermatobacter hominis]|uniref:TIGR03619 family F420-dependent LLM class oxidoreductase n=1 Tax=Dermatobacter hominis TaxID=2884263 RepID=UPI001D101822|nr:TIGR03619 family F420-dependent LLM class oxidoreductase [Dermatobacter hominis]UDY36351.1 TIGR03619 family F420-dependent LLM class oxidoreductase [Dermatobacter hominis]